MIQVKTRATEALHRAAVGVAARRGISIGAAYEELMRQSPRIYEMVLEERADAGAPGSTGSFAYANAVRRMTRPY